MSKGIYRIFRTKEELHEYNRKKCAIDQQQLLDIITITLHDELGMGEERINKFAEAFYTNWEEYCDMGNADIKDDKDFEYTKAKVDEKLKSFMGESFKPWEWRYHVE